MAILEKDVFALRLRAYYETHYGARETDRWYDQPAVNVWVFGRDGCIITLKSDVLTGEIEVQTEEIRQ